MEKIKVGIAGLGRLGKVHAHNLAYKIPNACLKAACSIVPAELEYAKNELGVTVEECKIAEKAVERHPELIFSWDLWSDLIPLMHMLSKRFGRE